MGENRSALSCFKAYDIRGRVPSDINESLAYAIGLACPKSFGARRAVVGRDARLSGPELLGALTAGMVQAGIEVTDIGMCGTEEIYYASANHVFDLGIMITGSHNPADENGFKIVRAGAVPVSRDSGLALLRENVEQILAEKASPFNPAQDAGEKCLRGCFRSGYLDWLLAYTGFADMKPDGSKLRVLANAGNGCAGLVLEQLAPRLPFELVIMHGNPDGTFPHGVPNPLLPDRRQETAAAVLENGADVGVAFDGDFDRCFFYDAQGAFVESYYLIGLMASAMLVRHPGEKIVHDTRVYWNTREQVVAAGGKPVMGRTGHAFMKEKMRAEDAIYGGEMSAHHYFRDFAYCDSGILTMLFVLERLVESGQPLSDLLAARMAAFPCSGEINFRLQDPGRAMRDMEERYADSATHVDHVDGLNMEFADWRFNLRASNTEPLLRLNVESRGNRNLMEKNTQILCDALGLYP